MRLSILSLPISGKTCKLQRQELSLRSFLGTHFMKRTILLLLWIVAASPGLFSQSREGEIRIIASRVHLHFSTSQLEGPDRFIAVGFKGYTKDIDELTASFDRYILHDQDMVVRVEAAGIQEDVQLFRFFLSDLADANDFQLMLSMHGFSTFYKQGKETPVAEFSRTVYLLEKERNKRQEGQK